MRIAYRKNKNEIEILRCWSPGGSIRIPEKIDGAEVTAVAAYAFSSQRLADSADITDSASYPLIYTEGFWKETEELPEFCGSVVEEVVFPSGLREIGNYAFYGCTNLSSLSFSDRLRRLGAGIFTGCRSKMKLQIDFYEGEASCLKEICGEVRYDLEVELRYHLTGQEAGIRQARLLFPEHYEEAVENTPARILFTQHHGSGNNFRQCFLKRKLQYEDYDRLFPLAAAQETMETLARMIFNRLTFPYCLNARAQETYRSFGMEHAQELALIFLKQQNLEGLQMMTKQGFWTKEVLTLTIQKASAPAAVSRPGSAEILSYLMQEQHRLFPPRKKSFDL